jgi:hypothetical protein
MKKTLLLLACLSSCMMSFAQAHTAADKYANALIRPFLDSLRVDTSEEDMRSLRLVSVFPASRAANQQFNDFADTGILKSYTPGNPMLNGRVTNPIQIFDGMRIALEYALSNEYDDAGITLDYKFTSRAETSADGTDMIRQTLELTALPDQEINGGFVEAIIWDSTEDEPVSIGRPVYRHVIVYRGSQPDHYATHLLRDADGVYSPIDFTEGSDRTFPSFKGGRTGEFIYVIRTMKYPRKALENNMRSTVHVTMTVTAKGKVRDIDFMVEPDPVFRAEAMRLARKTSGKWIPATRNGENVDDEKVMHIEFYPEYAPKW